MNADTRQDLRDLAARLAELIVQAKPAQIRFHSEAQFIEMLALQQEPEPATVRTNRWSCRS